MTICTRCVQLEAKLEQMRAERDEALKDYQDLGAELARGGAEVKRIAVLIAPIGVASGAERWRWAEALRAAVKGQP